VLQPAPAIAQQYCTYLFSIYFSTDSRLFGFVLAL